jgi:hypothetical protein
MSRSWLLSLLCLCAAVVFVQLSLAQGQLTVNEPATKFLVQDETIVALEVVNPASDNLPVRIKLELLDTDDATRGIFLREAVLGPGLNKLALPLKLTDKRIFDDNELPWYRLRYRIDAAATVETPPNSASGVISLSQIDTPDIFAMQVSAPSVSHRGGRQYTHVRALHPLDAKPVKDVNVSVELKIDNDPGVTLRSSAVTDANGYALVSLDIPAKLKSDEGELKVVARHGGFVRESSNDLNLNDNARIMVTTDKPIYQPGQPLHVRALIFDSANHAAANAQATLKISDPENATVFETELKTSRFGVASADWAIPDNTNLGDYTVTVEVDDENYRDSYGYQSVKISRYDLPNFTVTVKPDRSYYLPQQNAGVEVRADYLFGQPVKRGHVRVVREEERQWNYREQKWDITAADTYEGETDQAGLFKVHIDLEKYHKNLAEADYARFSDLSYAAYFTDPTTNRTEQRRFDLRVTKDAIHIYVAEAAYRQAHGFPMQFFVATSLADGTPVSCDVAISEIDDEDETSIATPVYKTIRTNKYGIALVTGLIPRVTNNYSTSLKFTARNGADSGQHTESFSYADVPVIRVETDKPLYRPGETIKVSVTASEPQLNLFVDVSRDANIIESRSVALTGGATTFTLPYRPEFRDEVTISAYAKTAASSYRYDYSLGSRTILFPRDRDLKLNFRLDHADYKPGDEATVDFRILTPEGRPATSALGIVIFDRAVEERARTDQDFSGGFGFYGSFRQWRGYDDQVGGITRKDLQRIDLTKPLPEGMELVARLLLGAYSDRPEFFETESFATDHKQVFADLTSLSFKPARSILDSQYLTGSVFPENGETLRRLLFEAGLNVDELKDPWGTPYREAFSINNEDSVLEVISAGPDKVFATSDDFSVGRITRAYFRFTGEAISRAVERYHARTGGFIREAATLRSELQTEGIDMDSLRDPWGQPYNVSFPTVFDRFNVNVRSSGPNKKFEATTDSKSDDFTLWIASMDYLIETRARIEQALGEYFKTTQTLPRDDNQLRLALAPVERSRLSDPWGHRFYGVYKITSRYADRASLQTVGTFGQATKTKTEITPVTQQVSSVTLRSSGEDGLEGTSDDFNVAVFSQLTGEQSSRDLESVQPAQKVFFSGAKGAIKGTVTDPMGASVAGVKVTATLKNTSQEFGSETDDSGKFLLRNLPAGFYSVRCDAVNFKSAVINEVPVSSSNITTLNFTLEAGNVSETVNVTAAPEASINTSQSSVSTTVTEGRTRVSIGRAPQLSTPRLREYFPETLVWQPALETDKLGRAQLKFKLADNITTWKMSVIGSTEDGEIGTAETEIKSFQPFFVEHDPPRILTEGDQISLPVVLRNYLERPQAVDLEIKPESWFTLQGPAHQRANVPAGGAARETFALTAVASVKDGKQRVTARGAEASDAIEKPVTVHPDGEEKTQTAAGVLSDLATLDLTLPAQVIPGSTEGEVKIYPSLMAHVVESIEGILERPHGCGEQTISSTYPSVLVLRRDKQLGSVSRESKKAQRYAELGYQRLLNYRTADGGFSYWGRGDADLALTAYALRFLQDVRQFVTVDDDTIKAARQWLIKQQRADGSWVAYDYYPQQTENQRRTALLTAFIARVLVRTEPSQSIAITVAVEQESRKTLSPELQRTLAYLATQINQIDEPYLIASYALAATDAGDEPGAARATARLRELVHREGDSTYWSLETNTPFYGWGLAGRVETTALAIQALARSAKTQAASQASDPLVRSGLLFLLKEKDRYGVWYSTQATINVLDTLVTLLATEDAATARNGGTAEIIVNGQPVASLSLPPGNQTSGPLRADISRFLRSGLNQVELRRPAGSAFASVQVVAHYYVPWSTSTATENTGTLRGETRSLRLATTFDKNTAKINEEIVCHVKAERVGFSGYGMMLAEIGLPPGADVDRASLESAMKSSDWAFSQYDVLPDRVVAYLWPRAGGVNFDFKFRPRFGLTAKAAPSVVYDYYNPMARAVVAPATFYVK